MTKKSSSPKPQYCQGRDPELQEVYAELSLKMRGRSEACAPKPRGSDSDRSSPQAPHLLGSTPVTWSKAPTSEHCHEKQKAKVKGLGSQPSNEPPSSLSCVNPKYTLGLQLPPSAVPREQCWSWKWELPLPSPGSALWICPGQRIHTPPLYAKFTHTGVLRHGEALHVVILNQSCHFLNVYYVLAA